MNRLSEDDVCMFLPISQEFYDVVGKHCNGQGDQFLLYDTAPVFDRHGNLDSLEVHVIRDARKSDPNSIHYVPKNVYQFRQATHPVVIADFQKAIEDELKSLEDADVGRVRPLSEAMGPGKILRRLNIVLVRKSGSSEKYPRGRAKARCTYACVNRVLKWFEKHAHMSRIVTYRLQVVRWAWYGLIGLGLDIKCAFLRPRLRP